MPGKYVFKRAGRGDLGRFFIFFKKSIEEQFPEYSLRTRRFFIKREYSPRVLSGQLKTKELIIYLAVSGKEMAGYLITRPIAGGVCLGVWLGVSEKHQRKGISTKLLALWEKETKKQGFHKLHIWADERNLRFYKNRGFKLAGKVPDNYYGHDDYFFHKTIQRPLEKNFSK